MVSVMAASNCGQRHAVRCSMVEKCAGIDMQPGRKDGCGLPSPRTGEGVVVVTQAAFFSAFFAAVFSALACSAACIAS